MSKITKFSVVVAEDEPKIRRNIAQKINMANAQFEVVGAASNGIEALSLIHTFHPDLLFTDIKMPMMDGLALINQVKVDFPEMHIIILSGYSDFDYAKQAMKMGVRDYLLKPLKMEALIESLENIKTIIEQKTIQVERSILTSDISGNPTSSETPLLNNEDFMVFLICIGNLCPPISPLPQHAMFHNYWAAIPINDILKSILKEHEKWWVVDEKTPNQKFLIISASNRLPCDTLQIAETIRTAISPLVSMLSVNICHNESILKRKEIWEQSHALRHLLDRELVIGKSVVFTSINQYNTKKAPILVDLLLRNKITAYIQSGENEHLKQEILQLFTKWQEMSYPQRLLEKATNQLIRTIYQQTGNISEEELYHLEEGLYEKLAIIPSFSTFFVDAWIIIESMLTYVVEQEMDSKIVIDQIAEYIKLNFTKLINFEEVAQKFHFTPPHLSKLFKKHYGESPLKFLIKLRIDEAIRLMLENNQLEIGKIGEFVGYYDQHYFSRIFKNSTGKSPSEFREQIREKLN